MSSDPYIRQAAEQQLRIGLSAIHAHGAKVRRELGLPSRTQAIFVEIVASARAFERAMARTAEVLARYGHPPIEPTPIYDAIQQEIGGRA